jgi:PAS domain S-box-containing protein
MTPELIKLLVVECNPCDADVVDKQLSDLKGFRFEIAHENNLAGGMHRASVEPFDAVLLALALPDSEGMVTCARMHHACGHVPIVVLTSLYNRNAGLEAVHNGAQDYLLKSQLNPYLLVRAVRYAIERTQATSALRASETEYRRLFESAKDGILILDAETGQINDANQFLIALLGYSKEELLAKKLWEIGLFQDIDDCKKGFTKLKQDGYVRYEDLPIVTKDGRSVNVEFVSNRYRFDGQQQRIQCNIRDITDRVRAEVETKRLSTVLHASETEYRRLFESAKDGILILDAGTGQINDTNQFLVDLLGYSKEEFLTKKLWEIGLFQDIQDCKRGFAKLQQENYVRYGDLPIVTKAGRSVDVEFVSNRYRFDGSQQRIQCNIRDITDRVRAEVVLREQQIQIRQLNTELEQRVKDRTAELEAANKELEAFAYSVSHDLRAPLRAIDGFVHLLQESGTEPPPEKRQHYLQMVTDNARQMSRLIDDLLRFSRTNRQSVQFQVVAPDELVRQSLEDLQAERDGRQIELQIGALPECWGDGSLLKQVWLNLIGNALKYTRKRDPAKIQIGSKTQDGQTVYFVIDNGVGFDMQYANKLFGVFQRLHTAEEFEGTGIGLALVQRILHRHGGRIWADGKVDQGATFSFTLGRRPSHA